jgi:glycosyltransferase involved in cell wall biosynthesis
MKKLKICLLSYRGNPYCGGQGVYLYYLAKSLAERGHEVTVLVGPPYPVAMEFAQVVRLPDQNFINKPGASAIPPADPLSVFRPSDLAELFLSRLGSNPEMLVFSLRAYAWIKKMARAGQKFDVVHDNQSLGYGLLMIQKLGLPVISTVHHPLQVDRREDLRQMPEFFKRVKRSLYYPLVMQKLVARRMDRVVTVSNTSKNLISDWYKIPEARIEEIPNGVDLNFFRRLPEVAKVPGRIIFVGSSEDRKKGILYLLQALKRLDHDAHLNIIDGRLNPERVYARNLVREMGLSDRVKFLEKITREQLIIEYNRAQVVVMPSLFEGFGLPAIEAMACGTALVAARAGGLAEVVGEGPDAGGVLVEPGDERALGEAIAKLLSDPGLRETLAGKGRQRVEKQFGWDKVGERLEQIYKQELFKRRGHDAS